MTGAVKNRYIARDIERTRQLALCRVARPPTWPTSSPPATRSPRRLPGSTSRPTARGDSIRSAVEREFTIIGEAIGVLSRRDPALAARISHARLIVGFRNRLVHEYPQVDDEAVYSIAQHDAPVLRAECAALHDEVGDAD